MKDNKKGNKERTPSTNETFTCVCDMEWRGLHDNEWSDCLCTPEEEKRPK